MSCVIGSDGTVHLGISLSSDKSPVPARSYGWKVRKLNFVAGMVVRSILGEVRHFENVIEICWWLKDIAGGARQQAVPLDIGRCRPVGLLEHHLGKLVSWTASN